MTGESELMLTGTLVDRRAELEQRYIQLLEKRIAYLEELAESSDKNEDKNSADGKTSDKTTETQANKDGTKKSHIRREGNYPVTFREIQSSPAEKDGFCEIDIERGKLRSILEENIGDYPGLSWEGDLVNIRTPFSPMVHNWKALKQATEERPDDDDCTVDVRQALDELLMQVETSPELSSFFKTRQSYLDAKIITHDSLWSLFVPGQWLYAKPFLETAQLFMVDIVPYSPDPKQERAFTLDCWCYDWNGKEYVKAYYEFSIDHFIGTKAVNELPCYPLDYFGKDGSYSNKTQLREVMIKRGARYNQHVRERKGKEQMFQYEGEALAEERDAIAIRDEQDLLGPRDPIFLSRRDLRDQRYKRQRAVKRRTVSIKGKYIIDAEAFLKYGGGALVLGDAFLSGTKAHKMGNVTEIAEKLREKDTDMGIDQWTEAEADFLALLPPRFLGYSTYEKFWGQFSVDGTQTVKKPSEDLFETKLQLDKNYKSMIRALVNHHVSRDQTRGVEQAVVRDHIEGKGKGLVILLHGPPGVGKTLTAETIAEATGKPLFVVSVADIGLNASRAEKNLEQMFALAGAWDAVLLVDEADVFLESRTNDSNTERNALVSVLLRILEYYEGIMILTTNRINALDVAVQSRIHLAVRYEDLKSDQKQRIFRHFLDQLEPSSIQKRSAINDWIDEAGCENDLNGRQIRNIVGAALALARSEIDGRVSKEHLKRVVSISKDFATDLAMTTKSSRDANEAGRLR